MTNWNIHDLSQGVHSCIGLFINTSYLGMKADHKLDNDLHLMSRQGFVYDINYNQKFTIFNQMANYRGIDPQKNVNGKYMLVRQAAESFKKWFNINLNKNDIDEAVNLCETRINFYEKDSNNRKHRFRKNNHIQYTVTKVMKFFNVIRK